MNVEQAPVTMRTRARAPNSAINSGFSLPANKLAILHKVLRSGATVFTLQFANSQASLSTLRSRLTSSSHEEDITVGKGYLKAERALNRAIKPTRT